MSIPHAVTLHSLTAHPAPYTLTFFTFTNSHTRSGRSWTRYETRARSNPKPNTRSPKSKHKSRGCIRRWCCRSLERRGWARSISLSLSFSLSLSGALSLDRTDYTLEDSLPPAPPRSVLLDPSEYHAPCTLHPTPCTSHPTRSQTGEPVAQSHARAPHTIHPTPYTLRRACAHRALSHSCLHTGLRATQNATLLGVWVWNDSLCCPLAGVWSSVAH